MLKRSELRKECMTILYQIDILRQNKVPYEIENVIKENIGFDNAFVKDIVFGVMERIDEIDKLANSYLNNWDIKRLDKTGAAILRMGIYEMKYMDTPPVVVINEAIELDKIYTDSDVVKMINAVLDKIYKHEVLNER